MKAAVDSQPLASAATGSGWDDFFARLVQHGFHPRAILDVGANRGLWTRRALEYFPNASYTLAEPQGHLGEEIRDLRSAGRNIRWLPVGVSDVRGVLPLSITPDTTSSSFVPDADLAAAHGLPQVLVEVRTIEDIVVETGELPDLLKIDAEGYDLKALRGAGRLLGETEVIMVEAGVAAPLIENTTPAVLEFMTAASYQLVEITELNRRRSDGLLWLCELAFILKGSDLLERMLQPA